MSDLLLIQETHHVPRSDAVKNRALLLETARRLFDEQGVDAITMSQLAEAAHVGKGTLYRHFADKTALCHALLDDDQRRLQEDTLRRLRQNPDALDNLLWFVEQAMAFTFRNAPLLCVQSQPTGSLEHPAHWWHRQTIRGLITQINPPNDHDFLADQLYILIDVHSLYFLNHVRGYTPRVIQDHLFATIRSLLQS